MSNIWDTLLFAERDEAKAEAKATNLPSEESGKLCDEYSLDSESTARSLLYKEETGSSETLLDKSEILDSQTEDFTEDELNKLLSPASKYQPLTFESPAEMFYTISSRFISRSISLYPWQIEILEFLASKNLFSAKHPLRFYLCANNGSGKDAFIIAGFLVWALICKIRFRAVVTSSSFTQLEMQTENYVRSLSSEVNDWAESVGLGKLIIVKKSHIISTNTRSEVKLFATDDAGKAEGYHPFPDHAEAEMAIIVNEAKSVEQKIFDALRRCTGFTYWIEISSSGRASGHFYNNYTKARPWDEGYEVGIPFRRKITADDCPEHISKEEIEQAAEEFIGGKSNPLYRSIYFSEFSSTDELLIIPEEIVDRAVNKPPQKVTLPGWKYRCGIDLAAGGDENSTYIIGGNFVTAKLNFREKDVIKACKIIYEFLEPYISLGLEASNTYGDDGGVGRAGLDYLRDECNFEINRILNNSPALDKARYDNRGAELWARFGILLFWNCFVLDWEDNRLVKQLKTRYYTLSSRNKIKLESKPEAKENGHESPDRADALVLSTTGLSKEDFLEILKNAKEVAPEDSKRNFTSIEMIEERVFEQSYGIQTINSFRPSSSRISIKPLTVSRLIHRRR